MAQVGAVIVAAGRSTRMGGVDKTFAPILGRPLVAHTLDRFESSSLIDQIVLVLAEDSLEQGRKLVEERDGGPRLRRRPKTPGRGPERTGTAFSVRLGHGP